MLNIKILTYDFVQKPQKKVALFMGHPVVFHVFSGILELSKLLAY